MVGVEMRQERKRRKRVPSGQSLSRTLALEQAYVHDVYASIATSAPTPTSTSTSPAVHAQVKQFVVEQFEAGSLLLDIGCSDAKYLNLNPDIVVFGLEHCEEYFSNSSSEAVEQNSLVVGDVMYLPFRDDLFDGVLCCSVLHHLSTTERRINALKEIVRIMKVGGKVMLTVTSGPADAKDLESQDVLIRFDRNAYKSGADFGASMNHFSRGGSDFDSKSYSSSMTNSSLELNNAAYENCASSPTSSEFENCYSFVKKALKRFSITSSIYSMKNSLSDGSSAKSKFSGTAPSLHDEMYPIELRNLEEGASSQCSSHSSSTTGDSALSSFNHSSSGCISQTSSNVNGNGTIFPSTLLAAIKEHLSNWKVQFSNSIVWNSVDAKTDGGDDGSHLHQQQRTFFDTVDMLNQSKSSHRFSLPVSLRNGSKGKDTHKHNHHQQQQSGGAIKSSGRSNTAVRGHAKNKHKVYALNEGGINGKPVMAHFEIDGVVKQVELNLSQVILPTTRDDSAGGGERRKSSGKMVSHNESIALATVVQPSEQKKEEVVVVTESATETDLMKVNNVPVILQKSFSSGSSRQTSFECTGYKLIAYYSMPELRTIVARPEGAGHQQPSSEKGGVMMMMHGQSSSDTKSSARSLLHSLETVANLGSSFHRKVGNRGTSSSLQSESKECLLAEMELELELSRSECESVDLLETATVTSAQLGGHCNSPLTPSPALSDCKTECETEADRSLADEMKENPSTLQQAGSGKFPKKLLRQRSFSADYQPEVVKFQPELPRRFSASPNIGTHRYNSNSHTPHHQQISIDSEESFVTIIPADHSRCTRDNSIVSGGCAGFGTDFDLELEDLDCDMMASNEDVSPNEIDQYDSPSEDDDAAYCENLSNNEFDSDDNTSISSVLEATIRSVISNKSADSNNSGGELEELPEDVAQPPLQNDFDHYCEDDEDDDADDTSSDDDEDKEQCNGQSAPPTLHRYFHLFRCGELESLIEEHIHNLHIIDSSYNEYATSWCIVAEKINVWTI